MSRDRGLFLIRIMKPSFYPPRLNPFLVRPVQFVAPCLARWLYQLELAVSPHDVEKIRSLTDHRLIFLPNHLTFHDPIVMFLLSARLGQPFYYLAAHELLSSSLGGFLQRIGVYSIRRGLVDRPSIAQTLALLKMPKCRLVVFPEGGCSFQNDTVMPFRAGAVQIAFQAFQKIDKQGEAPPDLYALPVSIKYRYTQDMSGVINQTLTRLEQALNLPATSSPYERLRAIAEQVLVKVEQDYGLHTPELAQIPWEQRISRLRNHVLEKCEQQLGIASHPQEMVRERAYKIEYALKTKADELEFADSQDLEHKPPSNEQQPSNEHANYAVIEKSVKRLLNFDAIYDGYVASNPTPERFLDTLIRLEREVFWIDQPPPKGFRQARVKIGEPVNLKDFLTDYQQERAPIVKAVMLKIQQAVQENLDELNQD